MRLLPVFLVVLLLLAAGYGLYAGLFAGAGSIYYGGGFGLLLIVLLLSILWRSPN